MDKNILTRRRIRHAVRYASNFKLFLEIANQLYELKDALSDLWDFVSGFVSLLL